MDVDGFLWALAMTESSNDSNVRFGDRGRALGRFQVHPDWLHTYSRKFGIEPKLNETWDSYITRVVRAFVESGVVYGNNSVEIAMWFHVGHRVHQADPDWDHRYADRFEAYYLHRAA